MKWFIGLILSCLFISFLSAQTPEKDNWMAIYIWDSFAPLTLDRSSPEMLISLEVIFQQHATFSTKKITKTPYGHRSTEGHFMVWLHVAPDFFERNGLKRSDFPEKVYMFPGRETDIFTAWCGQANFRDFILDGVSGMANQTIFNDGSVSGELDHFGSAVYQGDAEYGAGFYLDDEQMLNVLNAIMEYPGFEKGYGFIARKENRPEQDGFEPPLTQGVNGYNCNDFAFYLIEKAGIMTKQETEDLKVEFWYPEFTWDSTIPLTGSGARIYKKFTQNRELFMGRNEILKLAWTELLFSGLDIFDEKELIRRVMEEKPKFNKVRIWDQVTMINYLRNPANRDFKAKLVMEELKPAVDSGEEILVPWQECDQVYNYRATDSYRKYSEGSSKRTRKKLKKAGLTGEFLKQYQNLEVELKK